MMKILPAAFVLSLLAIATVAAQDKKVTMDDFVGTWNIEVMSHQIALIIEKQDATKATATMMMMGRDVPLKGELVDRTITFTGVKDPNAPAAPQTEGGHAPPAKPIVVTMQDDGTITGEMMTTGGPAKWNGEKLRTRKKPQ